MSRTRIIKCATPNMKACLYVLLAICVSSQVGCAVVGPDFRGVAPPPVGSGYLSTNGRPVTDTAGISEWWHQFNDPTLFALLQRAEQGNFTLQEAAHRILESRARLGVAGANFAPDVDFNGSYQFTQTADNGNPFVAAAPDPFDLGSVGFDAGWEIDLFGRLTRLREAAKANLQVSEFDRRDIRITLLAEVAAVYVQIRSLQQQIDLSRANLAVQESSINLVKERESAGVSTKLDTEQALGFKFRTEANTHQLGQQLEVALNQLSVLLGSVPTAEIRMLVGHGRIPFPAMVGIGMPANLVRLRPDIRSAEAEVAAASAQIGVAVSDLYPQLDILGTISLNSQTASNLFTDSSLAFAVGPSLSWNILSFGRICFNIKAQKALLNQRVAAYREAVIQAVREVEDGIAQHDGEVRRAGALQQAVFHDRNAVTLSTERYKFGKANYQRVLDSEQQLLQDGLNEAQAQANSAIQMIRVFKALGGGQGPLFTEGEATFIEGELPSGAYGPSGCDCDGFAVGRPDQVVTDFAMGPQTGPVMRRLPAPGSHPAGIVAPAIQQAGYINYETQSNPSASSEQGFGPTYRAGGNASEPASNPADSLWWF